MPDPSPDLVERLLAGTGGGKHWMDLHEEAAAEITRLQAEVAGWRAGYENLIHDNDAVKAELRAEVEALRKAALMAKRIVDDECEALGLGRTKNSFGWDAKIALDAALKEPTP